MTSRPAPTVTPFFWNGVRERRLAIQRCRSCAALRHPPRPMCPHCQSLECDTVESSGRGTLHSFVMPQHPVHPWFDYLYVVAVVELEEGIRLVSNLVDCPKERAAVGMAVEVVYRELDEGLVLPLFRPAGGRSPEVGA